MFRLCFKVRVRLKAIIYKLFFSVPFSKVGKNFKFFIDKNSSIGKGVAIGDNCWIETVIKYKSYKYSPMLEIGDKVMLSDNVHISCCSNVVISDNCLIGSNVYIGDHSHGSFHGVEIDIETPPSERCLGDVKPIKIGKNVWIGDGAVILAGSYIPDGSVIGANSVVKGRFDRASIITGAPAKVKRLL